MAPATDDSRLGFAPGGRVGHQPAGPPGSPPYADRWGPYVLDALATGDAAPRGSSGQRTVPVDPLVEDPGDPLLGDQQP